MLSRPAPARVSAARPSSRTSRLVVKAADGSRQGEKRSIVFYHLSFSGNYAVAAGALQDLADVGVDGRLCYSRMAFLTSLMLSYIAAAAL